MRLVVVLAGVVACSGCYTYRDKVAHRRGELVLADRGAAGDELAAAVAVEVGEANIDSGAAEITADAVELTVEASQENAKGIRADREARSLIGKAIKAIGGKIVERLPWIGPVVGFAAAAVEWLRRRKAQLDKIKVQEVAGVLGRIAGKVAPEDVAPEASGLKHVTVSEIIQTVESAKNSEF